MAIRIRTTWGLKRPSNEKPALKPVKWVNSVFRRQCRAQVLECRREWGEVPNAPEPALFDHYVGAWKLRPLEVVARHVLVKAGALSVVELRPRGG